MQEASAKMVGGAAWQDGVLALYVCHDDVSHTSKVQATRFLEQGGYATGASSHEHTVDESCIGLRKAAYRCTSVNAFKDALPVE